MQYMLLIYTNESAYPEPKNDEERQAQIAPWLSYTQALREAGVFVAGDALLPTSTATTVTKQGGKLMTTDGPFAETKEQLAGYYLVDCADLDAALKWAELCPGAAYGKIEVRAVMNVH